MDIDDSFDNVLDVVSNVVRLFVAAYKGVAHVGQHLMVAIYPDRSLVGTGLGII